MLSIAEEAIIIAFRRHTRPPLCAKGDIDHRLTKPKQHPWTNGQVERMNRTLKDATIKALLMKPTTSCEHPARPLRPSPQLPNRNRHPTT